MKTAQSIFAVAVGECKQMRAELLKLAFRYYLLFIALTSTSVSLYAYNFEAEGTLKCNYFSPYGTNTEQKTGFVVSVDDNRWSIKTMFGEGWYSVHGCDGTNIYAIFYDPHPVSINSKKPVTLPYLPGHITEGVYPLDVAYYTTMPWLAFASTDYLESGTNSLPCFWRIPRSDPMAWIFETKIERSKAPPYLPAQVKFITSIAKLKLATKNPALRLESPSKWEYASRNSDLTGIGEGKVGGEFHVIATTNFNGLEIPIEFEGVTYLPKSLIKQAGASATSAQSVSDGDWTYTNLVFIGRVTRITNSGDRFYLPLLDKNVSVTDFRFRDSASKVDYLQYAITNSTWPSDKDPILVNAFEEKKKHLPQHLPRFETEHRGRSFILVIFGLVTFLPILLLVKNWLKQKQRNQQK